MVQSMALCGLGKSAPLPVISTLKRFRDEYEEHIRDKKCRAKVCTALRQFHINPEFCIGGGKCAKNCPADAIDLMDENGYEDLSVNSSDICGRISMSSVLIYPPGMPVVNVGERITGDVCRIIKSAINAGLEVPGLKEGKIRCLR